MVKLVNGGPHQGISLSLCHFALREKEIPASELFLHMLALHNLASRACLGMKGCDRATQQAHNQTWLTHPEMVWWKVRGSASTRPLNAASST